MVSVSRKAPASSPPRVPPVLAAEPFAPRAPGRTCVGCRRKDQQQTLRRLVLDAAGRLVLQRAGKLAGRGAYVHWNEVCLAAAVTRGGFDRSFRRKVLFPKTSPPYQFLLRDEEALGQDQRN